MLSDSKLEVTSLDFNKFSFYTDKSHTGHTFIFLWSVSLHTSPQASPESLDLYHTPQLSFLAPTGVTIPETPTDFGEGNQTCWRGPGEVIREWKSKTCFFSAHWTCNTWLSMVRAELERNYPSPLMPWQPHLTWEVDDMRLGHKSSALACWLLSVILVTASVPTSFSSLSPDLLFLPYLLSLWPEHTLRPRKKEEKRDQVLCKAGRRAWTLGKFAVALSHPLEETSSGQSGHVTYTFPQGPPSPSS